MVSFWRMFFVDILWCVWCHDINVFLDKLVDEKFVGVMFGDAGGGSPCHSQ